MRKTNTILINFCLTLISLIVGFRLFNYFLIIENQSEEPFIKSSRKLPNKEVIKDLAHPIQYSIQSKGKDTILLVGDSFGVGDKCGN